MIINMSSSGPPAPQSRAVRATATEPQHARCSGSYESKQAVGFGDGKYEYYPNGEALGSGTFGSVWKCTRRSDHKIFAAKKIDLKRGRISLTSIENECKILGLLEHGNIIKYVDRSIDDNWAWIVMEFAPGKSITKTLDERAGPFTEDEAKPIFKELCAAVHYLHCDFNQPFIHRDIKPDNITIERDPGTGAVSLKLVDFGIAKRPES